MTKKTSTVKKILTKENSIEKDADNIAKAMWDSGVQKMAVLEKEKNTWSLKHPYCYGFQQNKKMLLGLNAVGYASLATGLVLNFPSMFKIEFENPIINSQDNREVAGGVRSGTSVIMICRNTVTGQIGVGNVWESYVSPEGKKNKFATQNATTKALRNAYKAIIPVLFQNAALLQCVDKKSIEEETKLQIDIYSDDGEGEKKTLLQSTQEGEMEMIDKKIKTLNVRKDIVAVYRQYKETHSHSAPEIKEGVFSLVNRRLEALQHKPIKTL